MPPSPLRLSRRALVGAAVLGTAGCSFGSLDPTPEDPTITPSATGTVGAAPEVGEDAGTDGADAALVEDALVALSTAHAAVRDTAAGHPPLAAALRPLVRLHRAHAGELGGLRTPSVPVPVPPVAAEARREVIAVEESLSQTLETAAIQAGSGSLAQLFASMAAAVAQQRSLL